jgi:carbohydrate-selective porin OprB
VLFAVEPEPSTNVLRSVGSNSSAEASAAEHPHGPECDYATCLFGDWAGLKPTLEQAGIGVALSYNSTYQVNVHGGLDTENANRHRPKTAGSSRLRILAKPATGTSTSFRHPHTAKFAYSLKQGSATSADDEHMKLIGFSSGREALSKSETKSLKNSGCAQASKSVNNYRGRKTEAISWRSWVGVG